VTFAAVALAAATTVAGEAAAATSAVVAAAAAMLVAASVAMATSATVAVVAAVAAAVEALGVKACPRGSCYAFIARALPSWLGFASFALVACSTHSRLGLHPRSSALPTHNNQTA
jgi:hypothetical protein